MYRAVTLKALRQQIDLKDEPALTALAESLHISFRTESDLNRVFVNDEEVTSEIRTPEVNATVSQVSVVAGVRKAMVARQRKLASDNSIVVEGRDTTTVVFPNADLKIFLVCDINERARRRLLDMQSLGVETTVEDLVENLASRDRIDSTRSHSPLTKADDAVEVDTTELTIDGQVSRILELFEQVLQA